MILEIHYEEQFILEDYFIDLRGDFSETDFKPKLESNLDEWKQKNGARGLMKMNYEHEVNP